MNQIILKVGAFSGAVIITGMIIIFSLTDLTSYGFKSAELVSLLLLVIVLKAADLYTINFAKNHHYGGIINFKSGFQAALQITLLVASIVGIYIYIHLQWVDPGLMELYYGHSIQQLQSSGVEQELINQQIDQISADDSILFRPSYYSMMFFMSILFTGLILAVITAFILKKDK